jgi:hypothetical protein
VHAVYIHVSALKQFYLQNPFFGWQHADSSHELSVEIWMG